MRRRLLSIAMIAVWIVALCGCENPKETDVPLGKTVLAVDGTVAFRVPDNWEADFSRNTDAFVLTITDNVSAYAHVYYYACDEDYATLDDFLTEFLYQFGDDIVGGVTDIEINGMRAKKFEYFYDDYNEHFEEARFCGFLYLIDAPDGVINVDVYYTQIEPFPDETMRCTPDEKRLLQSIAESLTITEAPDIAEDTQE